MTRDFNIGRLYTCGSLKTVYNTPNPWGGKPISHIDKNEPFVILDVGFFANEDFLQVLTTNGVIGFIKLWGTEHLKEAAANK